MIFDCPRCEAENAIPVADIPAEGKVAMCVGCKQPFRVLPPDPEDVDEPEDSGSFESQAENTTVGGPLPFDDAANDDPTSGFFVPPIHTSGSATTPDIEPPLIARDTSDLPPEILGGGLGASVPPGEVGGTDDTLLPADGRALGRRLRSRPADDRTPPSGTPALVGVPAPAISRPTATPLAVPLPAPPAAAPRSWHSRIPLAAKVGLAVFPVALVAAILLRPGTSATDSPPIALPIAPRIPTTSSVAAGGAPDPDADATPSPTASAEPALDRAKSPVTHDVLARDGYAYVATDGVSLRPHPSSGAGATVEKGALVRVIQRIDDSAVVLVEPKGPVGFAPAAALDVRMPVSALAAAVAFEGCAVRATCADTARVTGERCARSCAATADDTLVERCRDACSAARVHCEQTCEGASKPKDPKRR